MLVLTRKVGQKIHIGSDVVLTVLRIQNDRIRVGIEAPAHVMIRREEVDLLMPVETKTSNA